MDFIPFNSRDTFYKSKFGAVKTGEQFRLRLILPRSFSATAAYFMLRRDDGDFCEHKMCWAGMNGDDKEIWDIELSVPECGLYWYHFDYDSSWGRGSVYNIGDGKGDVWNGRNSRLQWQLTVYDKNYKTPSWLKGGIMYQIFPDRFFRSGEKKENVPSDRILRDDFDGEPIWRPNEKGEVLNNDYFGGDLRGITEKLSYLFELGVTCIYLNPIFEAHSNHRYNTADYMKTDPLLGTEEDFKKLCESAGRVGIKIILDGVFSHTGDDSRYFNRYSRYDTVGAYNSKSSPYFKWYKFDRYPDEYKSWWGFKTLPEVTEECPDYDEFICGKNGVIRKWLRLGASGWRLDVADELPDCFIDDLRVAVKTEKPDGILLGEVWEDATTKFSYGTRRRYLLGVQLDSVMNYPFAEAVTDFARNGVAESFESSVMTIIENYPKEALDVLMNHIGTHDTERAITKIAGEKSDYRDRQWQSEHSLSEEEYKRGVKLLKLCAAIQYTLPGVPCVYYGDEAGMQGYKDPFNRAFFPWGRENRELQNYYIRLGKVRRSTDCLKEGEFIPVSSVLSCVCFERRGKNDSCLLIANRNEQDITYYLPPRWQNTSEVLLGESVGSSVLVPGLSAVILKKETT